MRRCGRAVVAEFAFAGALTASDLGNCRGRGIVGNSITNFAWIAHDTGTNALQETEWLADQYNAAADSCD